jgi:hypothetical protein
MGDESKINDILGSKAKPKERTEALAALALAEPSLIGALVATYERAPVPDKGTCMEALEAVSAEHPDLLLPHLAVVIEAISSKPPRVKWESSRIIGNLAAEHANKIEAAIPALLANTEAEGTVVRWSAAFALDRIARHSPKRRAALLDLFREIIETEENGGVRKIYEKALKDLQKV